MRMIFLWKHIFFFFSCEHHKNHKPTFNVLYFFFLNGKNTGGWEEGRRGNEGWGV